MTKTVRAFPILPGKHRDILDFANALTRRNDEASGFYESFGVTHESWHLQETGQASWVICVTEIEGEPRVAAKAYAASTKEFDSWFKGKVRELTGIDPDKQPLGPPTEEIFSWSRV